MEDQSYGATLQRYWVAPLEFGRDGKPLRTPLAPPPGIGPVEAIFISREGDLWAALEVVERRLAEAEQRAVTDQADLRFRAQVYDERARFRRYVLNCVGPIWCEEEVRFFMSADGLRAVDVFETELLRFETSYAPSGFERVVKSPPRSGVQIRPYRLDSIDVTPEQHTARILALCELAQLDTFQTGWFEREYRELLYDIKASRAPSSELTAADDMCLDPLAVSRPTAAAIKKHQADGGKTLGQLFAVLHPGAETKAERDRTEIIAIQATEPAEDAPAAPEESAAEARELDDVVL